MENSWSSKKKLHLVEMTIIAVVMLCTQFGSSHAQAPEPIFFPISQYAPLEIGIQFSGIDLTGTDLKTTGAGSSHEGKDTGPDMVRYVWTTNATGSWEVDLYANYSMTVTQTMSWYIQSVDYRGLPLSIGPRPEKFTGQYLWIHFTIQTWTAPRPPTLEEEVQRILQPGSPLMQHEDANAANWNQVTADIREIKNMFLALIAVIVAIGLLWFLFGRK